MRAVIVPLSTVVRGVATHASDDLVIATAVSGSADYLVTGDRDLRLRVREYGGVAIVSPAEFLEILARRFA